jgi:hypothetical protein
MNQTNQMNKADPMALSDHGDYLPSGSPSNPPN